MEVRKYSAEYHQLDTKFRRPNLELINAYSIQNPFLFGCYTLRQEQMKMKMEPDIKVKERFFYFPATFDTLEDIVRNGFTIRTGEDGIKFYTNSQIANVAI